jgi:hypothetical protein
MTLTQRIWGAVVHPRRTFDALLQGPTWLGTLLGCTILSAAAWAALYSTEIGRVALVDQLERTILAMGRPVTNTSYTDLQALSHRGPGYAVARAVLLGPVLVAAIGIVLHLGARLTARAGRAGRSTGRPASLRQCLALATHAGVILAVRDIVAAPLSYVRETTASVTTLRQVLPLLDDTSMLARFLGSLDVFVLWWAALVGLGAALVWGRAVRRMVAAGVGVFVAGAGLVAVGLGLAGGGG